MIQGRYGKGKSFVTQVFWSTGAGREVLAGTNTASPDFVHTVYGHSGRDVAGLSANAGEGAAGKDQKKTKGMGKGEVLFPPTAKFGVAAHNVVANPSKGPIEYRPTANGAQLIKIRTTVRESK
jgi:hypothetical protein